MKSKESSDNVRADFRKCLKESFLQRKQKNSRYSLRAFAKKLSTHHGTLSQIMRGKRAVTRQMISRLGNSLGLTQDEIILFQHRAGGVAPGKAQKNTRFTVVLALDPMDLLEVRRRIRQLEQDIQFFARRTSSRAKRYRLTLSFVVL